MCLRYDEVVKQIITTGQLFCLNGNGTEISAFRNESHRSESLFIFKFFHMINVIVDLYKQIHMILQVEFGY